jgi:hypothetical protein
VTVLDAAGDGYGFTLPAGARRDVPTDESGYTRLVLSENGAHLGEYPLSNPDLHSFCDVAPPGAEPRLYCGISA